MLGAKDKFHGAAGTTEDDTSGRDGKSMLYKNPFEEEVHYDMAPSGNRYFTTFCGEATYFHESDDDQKTMQNSIQTR